MSERIGTCEKSHIEKISVLSYHGAPNLPAFFAYEYESEQKSTNVHGTHDSLLSDKN